jgi:hypothetical protein
VHQLFIATSLQLLIPVLQTIFFVGAEIFNPQKKRSAKIKCHLFRSKPQKFHTAEITGYTVYIYIVLPKIVEKLKHYKFRLFRNRTKAPQTKSPQY